MSNEYLKSKGSNDECYTPSYAIEPLLEFLEPFRDKTIWCPFSTNDSEFVKVLTKNGYKVIHSHIKDNKDFFTYQPKSFDLIIDNPPFTNKRLYFERCISFGKPFALLMTILWLNDKAPKDIFKDIDLELLLFDKRIKYNNQSQKGINFASAYYCYGFLPKQIEIRTLNIK